MKTTVLASVLALAATVAVAAPVTVNFENIAASNSHTNYDGSGFNSQGFVFALDHGHVLDSTYTGYAFNNGTDFLMHDSYGAMNITLAGGGTFNLSKFDFGHYYGSGSGSSVTMTGFYANNSSVSQVLTFTDSIQTLALGSAWNNLSRVQFAGDFNQAYDNFVFNQATVPEPASLALAVLALGGVRVARRRRA